MHTALLRLSFATSYLSLPATMVMRPSTRRSAGHLKVSGAKNEARHGSNARYFPTVESQVYSISQSVAALNQV